MALNHTTSSGKTTCLDSIGKSVFVLQHSMNKKTGNFGAKRKISTAIIVGRRGKEPSSRNKAEIIDWDIG